MFAVWKEICFFPPPRKLLKSVCVKIATCGRKSWVNVVFSFSPLRLLKIGCVCVHACVCMLRLQYVCGSKSWAEVVFSFSLLRLLKIGDVCVCVCVHACVHVYVKTAICLWKLELSSCFFFCFSLPSDFSRLCVFIKIAISLWQWEWWIRASLCAEDQTHEQHAVLLWPADFRLAPPSCVRNLEQSANTRQLSLSQNSHPADMVCTRINTQGINNNVHLSCAHQRPERSHDTY